MALYAFADTHLSLGTNKPMDIFGARWKLHTEKIKGLWSNILTDDDTVVIAGDISWALTLEEAKDDLVFLSKLPGKKILMRGNHDYWWTSLTKNRKALAELGIENIDFLQNDSINIEGFTVCGTRGWYYDAQSNPAPIAEHKKIVAREAGRLRLSLTHAKENCNGREIALFMHFPPVFGGFVCRELVDILHEFEIKRIYYGHIHGNYYLPPTTQFEGIEMHIISGDYLDFRPKTVIHGEQA